MKELTMKLAAAAAEAAAPQGPPQGGAPEGDPAAMGMPEQPMDPMEEDNQRLTNILENLRLRKEIVEAHKELEKLDQKKQQPASPADDLMTREGLSQVAEMPKRRPASGPETSGRKDSTKTRSATAKAEPTTPDSPDKETLKAEPMPQGQ